MRASSSGPYPTGKFNGECALLDYLLLATLFIIIWGAVVFCAVDKGMNCIGRVGHIQDTEWSGTRLRKGIDIANVPVEIKRNLLLLRLHK